MKIEHVAFNVADPAKIAAWYVEHIGLRIVRRLESSPFTHFLADDGGSVMLELYHNPLAAVPDYAAMHPLILHVALVSENPPRDQKRLLAAGATFFEEVRNADGTHLVMLRDPFGLALQLCKRGVPMLR